MCNRNNSDGSEMSTMLLLLHGTVGQKILKSPAPSQKTREIVSQFHGIFLGGIFQGYFLKVKFQFSWKKFGKKFEKLIFYLISRVFCPRLFLNFLAHCADCTAME